MQHPPLRTFIPGIIWFCLILVLICLPKSDIPELDGWGMFLQKIHFDKWVHAGMFGVLALLFFQPYKKTTIPLKKKWNIFLVIAVVSSLWGMTTEYIQLLVPGRSFDWFDWGADSLGILTSLLFARKYLLAA